MGPKDQSSSILAKMFFCVCVLYHFCMIVLLQKNIVVGMLNLLQYLYDVTTCLNLHKTWYKTMITKLYPYPSVVMLAAHIILDERLN